MKTILKFDEFQKRNENLQAETVQVSDATENDKIKDTMKDIINNHNKISEMIEEYLKTK